MHDNISNLLDIAADRTPDRAFLIAGDTKKSYSEVLTEANRIANRLIEIGVEPGQTVALMIPNSPAFISAFFGVLKTGAVAAPFNLTSPGPEIAHLLKDMEAVAFIPSGEFAPAVQEGVSGLDCRVLWAGEPEGVDDPEGSMLAVEIKGADSTFSNAPKSSDDLAILLSTSGTTGKAKGVELTHGNLAFMADVLVKDFWILNGEDTLLMAAPGNNIFGQATLLAAVHAGAALSLLPKVIPAAFMQNLARDRVTFFAGVPRLAQMMLYAPQAAELQLPALRRVLFAGTALKPELGAAFAKRFDCEVITGYGMTEGVPLSFVADLSQAPPKSVGRPPRETHLRIVGEGDVDLPHGDRGEVLAKGPQISPGYFNAPDLNEVAFAGGWYHTGDVGYLDEDGFLFLVDRIKDIIKTSGYTVYPAEVEEVLSAHPAVAASAVVGRPYEGVEEVVQAFVVLKPGAEASAQDLINYCKANLASYKCPRRVEFRESLPFTATGKVLKRALA